MPFTTVRVKGLCRWCAAPRCAKANGCRRSDNDGVGHARRVALAHDHLDNATTTVETLSGQVRSRRVTSGQVMSAMSVRSGQVRSNKVGAKARWTLRIQAQMVSKIVGRHITGGCLDSEVPSLVRCVRI